MLEAILAKKGSVPKEGLTKGDGQSPKEGEGGSFKDMFVKLVEEGKTKQTLQSKIPVDTKTTVKEQASEAKTLNTMFSAILQAAGRDKEEIANLDTKTKMMQAKNVLEKSLGQKVDLSQLKDAKNLSDLIKQANKKGLNVKIVSLEAAQDTESKNKSQNHSVKNELFKNQLAQQGKTVEHNAQKPQTSNTLSTILAQKLHEKEPAKNSEKTIKPAVTGEKTTQIKTDQPALKTSTKSAAAEEKAAQNTSGGEKTTQTKTDQPALKTSNESEAAKQKMTQTLSNNDKTVQIKAEQHLAKNDDQSKQIKPEQTASKNHEKASVKEDIVTSRQNSEQNRTKTAAQTSSMTQETKQKSQELPKEHAVNKEVNGNPEKQQSKNSLDKLLQSRDQQEFQRNKDALKDQLASRSDSAKSGEKGQINKEIMQSLQEIAGKDQSSQSGSSQTSTQSNATVNTQQTQQSEFSLKSNEAKQAVKQFASSLKEQVDNYKPPVSKLTLSLNPKSLGEVDVVIKTRGDQLSVQLSSSTAPALQVLAQNSQDLRQNLLNMGFENVSMQFSSGSQQEGRNEDPRQQTRMMQEFDDFDEEVNAEVEQLEIVLPRYV